MLVRLKSYACGRWEEGRGEGAMLHHAVTGEPVATASSAGLDFAAMLEHGRSKGGPALRAMNFQQRAELLKKLAGALQPHLPELYQIAAAYGATKADAYMDIEGGIGTLFVYSSLGRKGLPPAGFLVDGDAAPLSKAGNFAGRHIWVSLEGVAVQINAHNFPAWGMLEKLAPSLLAGMPALVKPATASAWLCFRIVELIVASGVLPEGALQLVCGSLGDLFDHLTCQDVVSFTGSAHTGAQLKAHPGVVKNSVRFNMEADSLNAIVLGPDVQPGTPAWDRFAAEVVTEMTVKAGQKCTAIRRVLVSAATEQAALAALKERLAAVKVGDPAAEGVKMGPLVNRAALEDARKGIAVLAREAKIVHGNPERTDFAGADGRKGAFLEPILLHCARPEESAAVHEVEVFGPVATLMPYRDAEQAVRLARRGGGSLVASLYSEDDDFARALTFGLAPYHGRLLVMNAKAAAESTGHGVAMPQLVHGGPGRAGGGEELGGLRSVYHYMQRVALQGTPERLDRLCAPALASATK